MFTKAGEKGWKSLIPIYSTVVSFRIAGINPALVLVCLAAIIPIVGWIAALGIRIYYLINLSKVFGKDGGFTVGLFFLEALFCMILGFGSAEYVGPKYGGGTTPQAPAAE